MKIGKVTDGEISVGEDNWGDIDSWKQRYDTAIEKHLNHYLPE